MDMGIRNDNQNTQQNRKLSHKVKQFHNKVENKQTKTYKYSKAQSRKIYHRYIYIKAIHILAMTTVFNIESISSSYTVRTVQQWDSDSGMIFIDNRCSTCMSHDSVDFVGDLQEYERSVKGFGGQTH